MEKAKNTLCVPWQLHRPGPYLTSGQTEWSWWLMSCRKETGDISNDHISDQLVLQPEDLVLTDVTARTRVFKAILSYLVQNLCHAF